VSSGHRNPQGLAFQPECGRLWVTEHGPSGFDGPSGHEEVNVIDAGGNYGRPRFAAASTGAT
jgi:glucose/arabinose dehydrogenase